MTTVEDAVRPAAQLGPAPADAADWSQVPAGTVRRAARLAQLQGELQLQAVPAGAPVEAARRAAAGGLLQATALLELQELAARLEADLRDGLARGAFHYAFQPVFRATNGELCGHEALLRWSHRGKLVAPAQFLPLIEESGLLTEIQAALLGSIAGLLALPGHRGYVSVNWSPAQLADSAAVAAFAGDVLARGIDPARIVIEITERTAMRQPERAQECLVSLKDHGFRVALDDFGRGHGGLSYLCNLPIDVVKVDQSLVQGLSNSPRTRMVLKGIVDVAHCLGQRVVAEGVETLEQLISVTRVGCDQVQGLLSGAPRRQPFALRAGDPQVFGAL